MWNLKLCQVASGIQLLDNMLIHVVPLYLFIPDWSLQAYDEVQLLATDCQTDSRVIGAFAPAPTEASDFNVTRGRKKTQNLWPGCSNRSAKLAPVRPPAATKVPNFRAGARPFE